MTDALVSTAYPMPVLSAGPVVPAIIAAQGDRAAWRYLEFFTVSIRNLNTRAWFKAGLHLELGKAGLTLPGRMTAP